MMPNSFYLVDSDVLITAKNRYYAFDICPGFWDVIVHHGRVGKVRSVDRVRSELLAGRKTEDLVLWVKNELSKGFFLDVDDDAAVVEAYTEIMLWVQRNTQYFDHAKAKFAAGADGWLVACAKVHNAIVITNEEPSPYSKREIKIPDVCRAFNVPYKDTFFMLRNLAVRFEWAGGN